MDLGKKIKIIERYDVYFSGINNKGAFVLTLNTVIISGFLIGIKNMKEMISTCNLNLFHCIFGITILITLISIFFSISAIFPHLDSNKKSFWFFNDVANRSLEKFKSEIDKQNDEEIIEDINEQIYFLARGLRKKHQKIRIALGLNFLQMCLIGLITYIILS